MFYTDKRVGLGRHLKCAAFFKKFCEHVASEKRPISVLTNEVENRYYFGKKLRVLQILRPAS